MSRFSSRLACLLALFACLTSLGVAGATTLDLSWNACSPLVTNKMPSGNPPSAIVLVVRATGQSESHTGFEFRINMEDIDGALPDAWRFDYMGCYGDGFISIQTDPATPLCPAFQGAPATVHGGISYEPYTLGGPLGAPPYRWALLVSSRYPATSAPPAGALRSLARVVFTHTYSVLGETNPGVNCGGFERNLCLSVHPGSARWLDAGGAPIAFQAGQSWLTFRDECRPVPAIPGTWGAIKSTYRR